MLAASRNDKVIGRTSILIVSIRIRAGDNQSGAFDGRRWAIVDLGAFCIAEIISINHKGRANERENKRWLVVLNTYGTRPIKFEKIINVKSGDKIEFNPFIWIPVVRLTCSDIILYSGADSQNVQFGFTQKERLVKNKTDIGDNHIIIEEMIDKLFILGSNEEKMSIIM